MVCTTVFLFELLSFFHPLSSLSVALLELYDELDGENWNDSEFWNSSIPYGFWAGVSGNGYEVTDMFVIQHKKREREGEREREREREREGGGGEKEVSLTILPSVN